MPALRSPGIALCLLLAAALFMRAFLPAGTMAERSDRGTVAVKLCSSGGVHLIELDKGSAPDDQQRSEPPCAFAGLSAPAVPAPPSLSEPVPPAAQALAYVERSRTAHRPGIARLSPPARGPPLPA